MRERPRAQGVVAAMVATVIAVGAAAAVPVGAEDPLFIPWSEQLVGFSTGYEPSSANDCKAGRVQCVDSVIREMTRRFDPLAEACDHNSMFALTYLRTTEEYRRAIEDPTFFSDTGFINHQDVVFAEYYFDAWDQYRKGNPVSESWRLAFDSADRQRVAGSGNLFLGMSAHVNRDLPLVLAEIGLVKPDGSSRKPDHDKVNEFLNRVMDPLLREAAARLDPTVDDAMIDGTRMDETAMLQVLVGWREQAWRNAERLVMASTPEQRATVAADIERQAAIEANLLIVATAYSEVNARAALDALAALLADPSDVLQAKADRLVNAGNGLFGSLFKSGAKIRNDYCAAHG